MISGAELPKTAAAILVVDDDDAVRDVVCLQLRSARYQPIPCRSAAEALNMLTTVQVDAVLSDIKMPGMTGIELLERIHADYADLPVILMTAYADLDTAVSAVKKGAFDFIIKPYKPDHLLHALEKAVRFRQLAALERSYRNTLEEFNAEIEALISERTMNLMALTVADKVRNPAFVIACRTRKLLADPAMPEPFRAALAEIGEEATRLEEIVQGFQSVLKSRESLYAYERLDSMLAEVITLAEHDAARKRVRLSFVPAASGDLRVNMQKNLLRTAFLHLVRNAIEASHEEGQVAVAPALSDENVVVTVSDNGRGIAAETLEKIFDPLYSTKDHGFGMGLPLVRQIIAEHMGSISAVSKEGTGTTFTISFPRRWKQQEKGPACPV